ncbi:class I SAM-dependent methyltransferase [Candidatus Woesebacteria bacterium]|nr:MAG: class I SAM-dependent methyltransferase [Candidatus Woesebacteria bacterium]
MAIVKSLLIIFVKAFFKIYFFIFGKPKYGNLFKQTLELYNGAGFIEIFSLIRMWDAPFEEINKLVPKSGRIIDLGCGDGILTNYLALSSKNRKLVGIEINKNRLKDANKGVENTKFEKGDIVSGKYPKADCIILSHVLHHLPNRKSQEKVVKETFAKLNTNGKLIIVEIIERPVLKSIFTWLTDAFIVPILFEKKLYDFNFHYRREKEWDELLCGNGYSISKTYPHSKKPFSHIIYLCQIKK